MNLSIDKVYVQDDLIVAVNIIFSETVLDETFDYNCVIRLPTPIEYVDSSSVDTDQLHFCIMWEILTLQEAILTKASGISFKNREGITEVVL